MRRDEIISAINKILHLIVQSKVIDLMRSAMGDKSQPRDELGMAGFALVSRTEFSETDDRVLTAFKIGPLKDHAFWYTIVGKGEAATPEFNSIFRRIAHFREVGPGLAALLSRQTDTEALVVEEASKKGKAKTAQTQKITFLVREPQAPNLTAGQLAGILKSIEELYNLVIKIYNLEATELIVGSLDSGSDKSIDVIGLAGAVERLSGFLLEAWDRVRFHKSAKMSASFKSAGDGLSLLTQITALSDKGDLSPEEGEKLRRSVIKNLDDLLSNGVYTRDMETNMPAKPSELEVERRKLITHFSDKSASTETAETKRDGAIDSDRPPPSGPAAMLV